MAGRDAGGRGDGIEGHALRLARCTKLFSRGYDGCIFLDVVQCLSP
jgi:hypothetical protein